MSQKADALAERNYFMRMTSVGDEVVRSIGSAPDQQYSLMYVTLMSVINSAQSQVWLTNAYFVPDPQMLVALEDGVARGVDVRLLLPGKSDSALVFYALRSYYDELLKTVMKIYERQDALLQAETAVIDGVWSTIGSTNLNWRSFLMNQAINAAVLGADFGGQMQRMFNEDVKASKLYTLESWCALDRQPHQGNRRAALVEAVKKFVSVSTAYEPLAEENALWSSRWIEKNEKHWQTNWPKRSKRSKRKRT